MKVIFLDIDGVLNSKDWVEKNEEVLSKPMPLTMRHRQMIDPEALKRLKKIVDDTGAVIVISSTWRMLHSLDELNFFFEVNGWNGVAPIIDKTSCLNHACRGDEIDLIVKRDNIKNFVIIDDDRDMLPSQMGRFVKTSWEHGLQDSHVEKAIEILSR